MPRGKVNRSKKKSKAKKRAKTPAPSSMLGSGLMGKAAMNIRKRRQMLGDI